MSLWELFNLSEDHNESNDLSSQYPERMCSMQEMHRKWYQATQERVSSE